MLPALLTAGSQILGAVGGLRAAPATPGVATSGLAPLTNNTDADFSGFTVATGRARADGATITKTSADANGTGLAPGMALSLPSVPAAVWYGVGALLVAGVAWRIFRK